MQRIIKHNTVRRVDDAPAPRPAPAEAHEAAAPAPEPGVRVHRADGRVHAIEITCSCGETTLVELDYEERA